MEKAQLIFVFLSALASMQSCASSEQFEHHLKSVTDNSDAGVSFERLGADITPSSTKDKKDIAALLQLWTSNKLDKGLGQGTIIEFKKKPGPNDYIPNRPGWRIDIQQNGAFIKFGISYYGLAIQNSSDKKQVVYSSALVPVNENVGSDLIRKTFLTSVDTLKVAIIAKNNSTKAWEIILEK